MLESLCHSDSCFVTLTYTDDDLTYSDQFFPNLCKRDLQLFLKRLRKSIGRKFRYYACGEYGEKSSRPHYHLILFGLSDVVHGEAISKCWPYGMVHVGNVTIDSAQYVAGYCTKKIAIVPLAVKLKRKIERLQGKEDLTPLLDANGRLPEFSTMSLKPGIGYPALEQIESLLSDERFKRHFEFTGDVPSGLLHGKKFFPFGRYLVHKLREMMELEVDPMIFIRQMRQAYHCATKGETSLTEYLVNADKVKSGQLIHRQKLYNKRSRI